MKVCIVQAVLDPYKGANHLPLYAALPDVQFTIVCNRSKVDAGSLTPNVEIVTVPGRTGSYYYGFADYFFARHVLNAYPEDSPFWKEFNVIHLNQVMGPALRRLSATGVPLLFLIHHPVTADREVAITSCKGFQNIYWRLAYFMLIRWQQKMCMASAAVITVSETMKKRIVSDYKCPIEKIDVVFNGVNGEDFPLVVDSECTADIVAVGSFIHPRKGFTYLLEVYKQLSQRGRSIADVGRRTDKQVAQLSAIPGVTVHGTVSSAKLRKIMAHTKVLVSTSLYEGFGLSLIEALSCGHPAYAFDVGAVSEVLGGIDATLVLKSQDTDSMVNAVEEYLCLDPKQRDLRGRRYREAVLQKFSLESSTKQLLGVYNRYSQNIDSIRNS